MREGSAPSQFVRVRFDAFELDEADARLLRGGEPIALAPKPFALLCALVRKAGKLVTKGELLDAIWGHAFVSGSVLKTAISELRTVLGDDAQNPRYIATVSRRGYRFIGVTSAITAAHLPRANASLALAPQTPPFTGRVEAIAHLRATWSRTCAGHSSVVWVVGDPGVGKTTLIDHFVSSVGDVASARGQCIEQYGAGEPYLPVLQGIAELCRCDVAFAELLRVVAPTWLLQLPWLSTPATRETLRGELTGAGQARMLREGVEVLERYAENRPVLLVTEDLHWGDHATVQLMDYMARRRSAARLLWLASFRLADIIAADHPLSAVRHELLMHGLTEEIALDAFSEQEVAQYVAARAPTLAADEPFVRALHVRTDGLPLFVADVVNEVMARGPQSGSTTLPVGLSGIIERYIRELAPGERTLLEAASVCGVHFRPATVARVLDRDAPSLAECCSELARRQRWLNEVDGGYAFRHTLYRTVLYQHIAPIQRVELHRKVADALLRERAETLKVSAAELAFHFEQGGEPNTALGFYAEAADSALQRYSPAETISLTERALSLLPSFDATSARTSLEITLATLQGTAAVQHLGQSSIEAKQAYQRAQSLLDRDPQHPLRGLLVNGLGVVLWARGELDEADIHAQRSVALADRTGDATTRLCACLVHGIVEHVRGRPRTARDWLEKAIAAAVSFDKIAPPVVFAADPTVMVLGLLALQMAHLGFVAQACTLVRRAHERAHALRAPGPRCAALWFDARVEVRLGSAERVADIASQLEVLSEQYALLPHVRPLYLWFGGWAQARLGDPRGGYARIREGLEQAMRFGLRGWMCEARAYGAEALARSGDWPAARQELDEAMRCADATGQRHCLTQLLLLDGQIADGLGEPQRARDSIRRAVDEARAQEAPWLELLAMLECCERDDATVEDRCVLGALINQLPEARDTTAVATARALLDDRNETR